MTVLAYPCWGGSEEENGFPLPMSLAHLMVSERMKLFRSLHRCSLKQGVGGRWLVMGCRALCTDVISA